MEKDQDPTKEQLVTNSSSSNSSQNLSPSPHILLSTTQQLPTFHQLQRCVHQSCTQVLPDLPQDLISIIIGYALTPYYIKQDSTQSVSSYTKEITLTLGPQAVLGHYYLAYSFARTSHRLQGYLNLTLFEGNLSTSVLAYDRNNSYMPPDFLIHGINLSLSQFDRRKICEPVFFEVCGGLLDNPSPSKNTTLTRPPVFGIGKK